MSGVAVARVGEVFDVKRQREREREREREMEIDEVCNELKDHIEAADSCNDVSILLRRVRLHPFSFIYQIPRLDLSSLGETPSDYDTYFYAECRVGHCSCSMHTFAAILAL